MDSAIASEIGRFLRNASKEPANMDDLLRSLEEARGKALQQGEYIE